MKKLLLLSLLLSSFTLSSQNYASILTDNSAWIYIGVDINGQEIAYRFPNKYEVEGDTIISGIVYQKIKKYPSSLVGGMREDSLGKVYFKDFDTFCGVDSTQERLIFDFSLELGDTLKVEAGDFCNPTLFPLAVTQVDSVETEFGEMRKRIQVDNAGIFEALYIIEGIGSNIDLLDFIGIDFYDGWHYSSSLICHHLAAGENYINPDRPSWTVCFLDPATSTNELPNQGEIQISPNPVASFLEIKGLEQISSNTHIEMFDINGVSFFQSNQLEKEISVSNLPSGIYFLTVKNDDQVWVEKFIKI